mgnify:CR=1 FL=1
MPKIRFIHTADIHLGSLLRIAGASAPSQVEEAVFKAVPAAFRRVCRWARRLKVDFMVISGDLYDREARSVQAQDLFVQECRRLQEENIDVFLIAGNHDPLRDKQQLLALPSNVKVFGSGGPQVHEVFDEKRGLAAKIVGQSYQGRAETRKIHLDYVLEKGPFWNIALLHTQLEPGSSNYVPCSLSELKEKEQIHYWALGHVHQQRIISDVFPFIAYPGTPQGRHFNEEGQKGCLLAELGGREESALTFLPTSAVIYERREIFLDQDPKNIPETLQEIEGIISEEGRRLLEEAQKKEEPPQGFVLEWVLRGRIPLQASIREQKQEVEELIAKNLRNKFGSREPFLWTDSVALRIQSPLDLGSLFANSEVAQELEAVVQQCIQDEAVQAGLRAKLGEIWSGREEHEDLEEGEDFLFHLDQNSLQELLKRARVLILEELAEGRE